MRRRVIYCNLDTIIFSFVLVCFRCFFSSVYYYFFIFFVCLVLFFSFQCFVVRFLRFLRSIFVFFCCSLFSNLFFSWTRVLKKRPGARYLEETMSTLRYADQAKSIVNSVRINEDPFARTVRRLNLEVTRQGGRAGRQARLSACSHSRENIVTSKACSPIILVGKT